jgi:hypothetical protein
MSSVLSVPRVPPLIVALQQVPDFRSRHGRRYSLPSVLALGIAAMLCGYDTYGAMAQWGNNYGSELAQALGFARGRTPSVGTLFTVFSRVDKDALHQALFAWNQQVLHSLESPAAAGPPADALPANSVDGKTLRGSARQGALDPHLLSAVRHGMGLTLGQVAVGDKENEIPAMKRLLEGLVLRGEVWTMDALLTQKDIALQIVRAGGST